MRPVRRLALVLLGISAAGALGGAATQEEPHPWIGGLYRDLRDVETDVNRGAWAVAEQRARTLQSVVADSLPVWRRDLENVRERGLISDFAVFVRDVPAAAARRDRRRLADSIGRCRAMLDQLRFEHEEPR